MELPIFAPVGLPIKDAGARRLRRCFASLTDKPTGASCRRSINGVPWLSVPPTSDRRSEQVAPSSMLDRLR